VRRTPVLLDGVVAIAAGLVADELAPGAREWWLLAQRSPEPAAARGADHLELSPLLDLQVRAEDGSGALAALPLLSMAARLLAETATVADSGIAPADRAGV
jgi:nicotinate-nucleotide--dimethylbenzimidazole phosphoribosyltransferase